MSNNYLDDVFTFKDLLCMEKPKKPTLTKDLL